MVEKVLCKYKQRRLYCILNVIYSWPYAGSVTSVLEKKCYIVFTIKIMKIAELCLINQSPVIV